MNRILLSTSLALALSSSLVFAQQQDAAPTQRQRSITNTLTTPNVRPPGSARN